MQDFEVTYMETEHAQYFLGNRGFDVVATISAYRIREGLDIQSCAMVVAIAISEELAEYLGHDNFMATETLAQHLVKNQHASLDALMSWERDHNPQDTDPEYDWDDYSHFWGITLSSN